MDFYGLGRDAELVGDFFVGEAVEVAQHDDLAATVGQGAHGLSEDFEAHSHHVLMQLLALFRSQDFREGIAAFVEKRDPRFEGR